MSSIRFDEARAIAWRQVEIATLPEGWISFYNSKLYLETGDIQWALGGNCPILVTKAASVMLLPTHTAWQDSLENLRAGLEVRKLGEIYMSPNLASDCS